MIRNRFFVPVLLGACVAAVAQQPPQDTCRWNLDIVRKATSLARVDGQLVGGGADYQAWFRGDGVRYLPALGRRAATDQPLDLQLLAVERGGELVLGATDLAPVQADAHTVVYPRAKGVAERFAIRTDGVELSWQFDQPLPGRGDLVVRYHLASPLAAVDRDDDTKPLAFTLPGVGGVTIGAVTGIDANGARTAGRLQRHGDEIDFVLPAAFVDHAAFPLVLDPLLGTQFLVETGGWNDSDVDAAYDTTSDTWLAVWRRVFSATSIDARGQRISGAGTLIGTYFAIEVGPPLSSHVRVASSNLRDRFVVVWQQAASILSHSDVMAVSVDAATGTVGTAVTVAGTTANEIEPTIVGDNSTTTAKVLVAYTNEGSGIGGNAVTMDAAGVLTVGTPVLVSANTAAHQPSFSHSSATSTRCALAWVDNSAGIDRLICKSYDRNFTPLGPSAIVQSVAAASSSLGAPSVDGDGINFVVAWQQQETSALPFNVYCRAVAWNGTGLATAGAVTGIDTEATTDQIQPSVGWTGYKFVVAYAKQFLGTNYDVRAVELGANCATCGNAYILQGVNTTTLRNVEMMPVVATELAGGGGNGDALILFSEADDGPPFTSSNVASRYTALGTGGAITLAGAACGVPGSIGTAGGAFVVGNTDFRVTLTGAPASSIVFMLLGLVGGEISCGSCTYVNPIGVVFEPQAGGASSYPYPLPCTVYQWIGTQVEVQWVLFNTGANPCPATAGMSFTRRLQLTLGL